MSVGIGEAPAIEPQDRKPSEQLAGAAYCLALCIEDQDPAPVLLEYLDYGAYIIGVAPAEYLEEIGRWSNLSPAQMKTVQQIAKNTCLLGDPDFESPDIPREKLDYIDLRLSHLFTKKLSGLFRADGF